MSAAKHDDPAQGSTGGKVDDDLVAMRIPVGRERIVVSKTEVERVAARVSLRTHVEDVPVSETLRTERVEIERIPLDRIVAEPPAPRVEDGVTIIPVVEEVLVRQFRIIEEVRIVSHAETAEHTETVTLRRQEAVVEDAPAEAPPTGGADSGGST